MTEIGQLRTTHIKRETGIDYFDITDEGEDNGIKMLLEGLKPVYRRPYRVTTNSDHAKPVAANVLERRFQPHETDQRHDYDAQRAGGVAGDLVPRGDSASRVNSPYPNRHRSY